MAMLQEKLTRSVENSQVIYDTMQELLERAKGLKRSIEDVIALKGPKSFLEMDFTNSNYESGSTHSPSVSDRHTDE